MKMESLKSSKFDAFKSNQILDTMNIIGGRPYLTKGIHDATWNDCWDDKTGDDIHCLGNLNYDKCNAMQINVGASGVVDTIANPNNPNQQGEEYIIGWDPLS